MYSKLQLSNPHDKLLALSAAAEAYDSGIQDTHDIGNQYMAGLWHQQLPYNLHWKRSGSCIHPRPSYRAPSWSWASIKGEVYYPYLTGRNRRDSSCLVARVLNCETQLAVSAAPYGQVKGGRLRIEALMKDLLPCSIFWDWIHFPEPEHQFLPWVRLDAHEPDLSRISKLGLCFTISILCIRRLPRNE
jgi:hypothetical protein